MQERQAPAQAGHQEARSEAPGQGVGGERPSSRRQSRGAPRGEPVKGGAQTAPLSREHGEQRHEAERGGRTQRGTCSQSPLALTAAPRVAASDQTNKDGEANRGAKTHRETKSTHHRERKTPRQCGQSLNNGKRHDTFFPPSSLSLLHTQESDLVGFGTLHTHTHTRAPPLRHR